MHNGPINFEDPSGLAKERGHRSNKNKWQKHSTADHARTLQAHNAAMRQAAEEAKRGESVLKHMTEDTINKVKDELQDEIKTLSKRKKMTTEIISIIEENKRVLDEIKDMGIEAHNNMSTLSPTRNALSDRAKSILKAAGTGSQRVLKRAAPVVGLAIGIYTWDQRRAEAGAVRATAEAIPVLGDLITVQQQYRDLRDGLDGITEANNQREKTDAMGARLLDDLASAKTIDAYNRLAHSIQVEHPEYINEEAVLDALADHKNTVHSAMKMQLERAWSEQKIKSTVEAADQRLGGALRRAVQQPGAEPSPGGGLL